jgi:hypothetical protein
MQPRVDRVVPDQHGAWGFLVLPVALGATASGSWSWAVLPVSLTWIALYPLSWAVSGRLTAPHRAERFDRALRWWACIAAPLMVGAVVLRPWLLWVGAAYLLPFAANLAFARARRERDLANDLVLVTECAAAAAVTAGVAAGTDGWSLPWTAMTTAQVGLAVLVCVLVLVGSTLHVKSLIRQRQDPRYALASRLFASVSVPVVLTAAWTSDASLWLGVPFVLLALRALFLRKPAWRPARLGMVELAGFILVAATAAVALH